MHSKTGFWACCALALSMSHAAFAAEPASCKKLTLAEIGWADITATNAIASVVAEGLGYQPQQMMASVPIAFTGVSNKQIDVFLGYWSPSMDPVVKPFIDSNRVKVLDTPNLVGAKYTLAVPTYAAEAGLKSFNDIAKFKEQLGGKIYAIEPGNEGNDMIAAMIKANQFDLSGFKMVESSESGMLVQVQRAVKDKKPVVFLAWAPHPMNTKLDITYLDGGDEVFGPDHGAAQVLTVITTDLEERCPNLGKLFTNLQFDVEMENQMMERILEKEAPKQVAADWLRQNPATIEKWLEGVTSYDGEDGVVAVKRHLNIQ